jgi:hypothetical protein
MVVAIVLIGSAGRVGRHAHRRLPPQDRQAIAQGRAIARDLALGLVEIRAGDVAFVPIERTASPRAFRRRRCDLSAAASRSLVWATMKSA